MVVQSVPQNIFTNQRTEYEATASELFEARENLAMNAQPFKFTRPLFSFDRFLPSVEFAMADDVATFGLRLRVWKSERAG